MSGATCNDCAICHEDEGAVECAICGAWICEGCCHAPWRVQGEFACVDHTQDELDEHEEEVL